MSAALLAFAVGACVAVDGDSLGCDGLPVRLARIDSVERHEGLKEYEAARDHLRMLIDGKVVTCRVLGRDYYGRLVSECGTDETPSLSDRMLKSGHAMRYRKECHGRQAECNKVVDRTRGAW